MNVCLRGSLVYSTLILPNLSTIIQCRQRSCGTVLADEGTISAEEPLLRLWCLRASEPLNVDTLELVGMVRYSREDPDVEFSELGMSEPQRSELADDTSELWSLLTMERCQREEFCWYQPEILWRCLDPRWSPRCFGALPTKQQGQQRVLRKDADRR